MNSDHHLAELNIGRLRYPYGDPRAADFFNNLNRINALAERSEGFVWRLKDESGNATGITPFDDPTIIPNLSVWKGPEALEKFVWQTVHKKFYHRKGEWFQPMSEAHFVMWWIEEGHIPTPAEALERLQHLREHGPSDYAFGWESLPNIKLWMSQQCA